MKRLRLSEAGVGIAIALWVAAVAAGLGVMQRYNTTPGPAAKPVETWPAATNLTRSATGATLLMFAHPKCPCTEASMNELARLLTQLPTKPEVRVVFVTPPGIGGKNNPPNPADNWENTKLWDMARAIPGVSAVLDSGGTEAKRFGATTSGHVVLTDSKGDTQYSGGITGERGHEGDNPGEDAVVNLLTGKPAGVTRTPVFGCPLEAE